MTARPRRRPARRAGEAKRDATRRVLLERALALFQHRGVDGTTMRDIARAAGLSLGAAYYHFPSKDALVFAYYEDHQRELAAIAAAATGDARARLGALFHGALDAIRPHRFMLTSILPHLVNPGDPLSAFSAQTAAIRAQAVGLFAAAIEPAALPPGVARLVARALWLLHLACMLVYLHDDSRGQTRTHGLVDDGLDLAVPLLPVLGSPLGASLCARIAAALERAGIAT